MDDKQVNKIVDTLNGIKDVLNDLYWLIWIIFSLCLIFY